MNDQIYFVTLTVKDWHYIFDRCNRWEILAESLKFRIDKHDLKIYGYVFMLNHIHLIIQSPDVAGFLRDYKKFTSRMIMKNVMETEPQIAQRFKTKNGGFEFWKKTNMPELIESEAFFLQKLGYVHNNPVRKQYVKQPEDWYWSSAIDYESSQTGPLPIVKLLV